MYNILVCDDEKDIVEALGIYTWYLPVCRRVPGDESVQRTGGM